MYWSIEYSMPYFSLGLFFSWYVHMLISYLREALRCFLLLAAWKQIFSIKLCTCVQPKHFIEMEGSQKSAHLNP